MEIINNIMDLSKLELNVYENNKDFFAGKNINIVDKICNDLFNVNGYLINCCH